MAGLLVVLDEGIIAIFSNAPERVMMGMCVCRRFHRVLQHVKEIRIDIPKFVWVLDSKFGSQPTSNSRLLAKLFDQDGRTLNVGVKEPCSIALLLVQLAGHLDKIRVARLNGMSTYRKNELPRGYPSEMGLSRRRGNKGAEESRYVDMLERKGVEYREGTSWDTSLLLTFLDHSHELREIYLSRNAAIMSRQDFENFCLLLRRWLVRKSCAEPGPLPHALHRQRSVSNLQVLDLSDNRLGSASMSDFAQAIMDASKVQPLALTQLMLRGE
ncbi:hypothetical protein GUITHDRAFT_105062 [Guillardia theta CCMP2712]|uniref:Uncharacterized protein n=1 Tax=Guillardia theta (strain CCMP2712) TaxID=905079 RepID=L1JLE8_GUITC|nr:hypothetical protein GUITHDRAFT_105062 [Guillardia theta CCMP2712]EKX48979.1 hypothetical protein GUITHDRAFT_105062 [Guillardia theta CCMP2712]|eukprot:XP_005835959.1 hypothetical protein GUITHDRAFT_105062 [Guillardia theta CCMP2712]